MKKCNGTKFSPYNSISLKFWTIFFPENIRYPFNIFPVIGTWGTKYLNTISMRKNCSYAPIENTAILPSGYQNHVKPSSLGLYTILIPLGWNGRIFNSSLWQSLIIIWKKGGSIVHAYMVVYTSISADHCFLYGHKAVLKDLHFGSRFWLEII